MLVDMKRIFFPAVLLLLGLVSSRAGAAPNFLVVLADDLGYGDLGCYGNEAVHTPHLDRLAAEGLRFTDCYAAAANCSPSRAGLMTGRTPWRLGIHNWIPMLSPMHLQASETTIATLLRDAGYATCHTGKWHLNGMFNLTGQPQPNDHGFDHWFSVQNNALPNHRNPYNFVRNGIPVGPLEGYSSGLVTDEAVRAEAIRVQVRASLDVLADAALDGGTARILDHGSPRARHAFGFRSISCLPMQLAPRP